MDLFNAMLAVLETAPISTSSSSGSRDRHRGRGVRHYAAVW
jgi:hypothetical protein